MCGFLQVIERGRPVDENRFTEAFSLLRHRGPDYSGQVRLQLPAVNGQTPLHVAVGHHRLAILDLDPRAHQPFVRGNCVLLFNGELYNFAELKRLPPLRDIEFQTNGDTEVLCEGLRSLGLNFLLHANGMWAFTFLDPQRRRVLASRDRYGKKPLFWYQDERLIIFSSTILPICRYLNLRPTLRDSALRDYLVTGRMWPTGTHETHFHEIQCIPSGHHLIADLVKWEIYFEPYFKIHNQLEYAQPTLDSLAETLRSAVTLRLVSDREVGLLLSGGVDSSLILAVLRAIGRHDQVRVFIGEPGRSADAEFAVRAARTVGVTPTVITLDYGKTSFERFLLLCRHHEKGFPLMGNSMAMAEMYEAIAAEGIPVVLDGTGGDEIFGGYLGRYFPAAVREACRRRDFGWLRNTAWSHRPQRRELLRTLVTWPIMNRWWQLDGRQFRKNLNPMLALLNVGSSWRKSSDPLDFPWSTLADALRADVQAGGRLNEWIWHNDRNAMMYGIENRSPFLDYRLAACIGTGYRAKFHQQFNKHELRQLFDFFVQLPTQWRVEKQGFRWNRKEFLRQNRQRVLMLIGESPYLQERLAVRRYVDWAYRHDRVLTSSLTNRLLCLAGLDQVMRLNSE